MSHRGHIMGHIMGHRGCIMSHRGHIMSHRGCIMGQRGYIMSHRGYSMSPHFSVGWGRRVGLKRSSQIWVFVYLGREHSCTTRSTLKWGSGGSAIFHEAS
jgi:hypothetical protein